MLFNVQLGFSVLSHVDISAFIDRLLFQHVLRVIRACGDRILEAKQGRLRDTAREVFRDLPGLDDLEHEVNNEYIPEEIEEDDDSEFHVGYQTEALQQNGTAAQSGTTAQPGFDGSDSAPTSPQAAAGEAAMRREAGEEEAQLLPGDVEDIPAHDDDDERETPSQASQKHVRLPVNDAHNYILTF